MGADGFLGGLRATAVYIVAAEHACHTCARITPVFAVLLVGPFEPTDNGLVDDDDFPVLVRPKELPTMLGSTLDAKSGGHFRRDLSLTIGEPYWMNHCKECGAKIGDWYIHEAEAAFFPTSDAELVKTSGVRVEGPFDFREPELSVSSWTTEWIRRFS